MGQPQCLSVPGQFERLVQIAEFVTQAAREAGLTDIVLKSNPAYVEAMTNFEDPLYQQIVAHLPPGAKPGDYIVSLEVQARKPGADCCGNDCCQS